MPSGSLKRLVMQNQQLVCFQSQAGKSTSVIVRELNLKHARIQQLYNGSHLPAAEYSGIAPVIERSGKKMWVHPSVSKEKT